MNLQISIEHGSKSQALPEVKRFFIQLLRSSHFRMMILMGAYCMKPFVIADIKSNRK